MRTNCTVRKVEASPFIVTEKRPYEFMAHAMVLVKLDRDYTDGKVEKAILEVRLQPGYTTDGASTFWPISKLVPQWRAGDDAYNAGQVVHDVLYMLSGIVEGEHEPVKLSREEADDILRGIWRCWGMSRALAGLADKGIELFAGGKRHWGSDQYGVRSKCSARWLQDDVVAPIKEA